MVLYCFYSLQFNCILSIKCKSISKKNFLRSAFYLRFKRRQELCYTCARKRAASSSCHSWLSQLLFVWRLLFMGGERGPVVMTSVREKQGSPHPNRLLLGRSTAHISFELTWNFLLRGHKTALQDSIFHLFAFHFLMI